MYMHFKVRNSCHLGNNEWQRQQFHSHTAIGTTKQNSAQHGKAIRNSLTAVNDKGSELFTAMKMKSWSYEL